MTNDLEPSPELKEKDFIKEGTRKPNPFWTWIAILIVLAVIFWGVRAWYLTYLQSNIAANPFLKVTNRDFSLFLWQNPEFMKPHSRAKVGYLPAFHYTDRARLDPLLADQYVIAPPDVLFLYHVWHRLLGKIYFPRSIFYEDFQKFLSDNEEWNPNYWRSAPQEYTEFFNKPHSPKENIADLEETVIPRNVRVAFQGWMNFSEEGEQINALQPTFGEVETFINTYPRYARNYWRNILEDSVPDYLKTLNGGKYDADKIIPKEETAGFLKVALFNAKQSFNIK